MKKLLLFLVLAVSTPAFADAPTDVSLKELFVLTDTKGMVDTMFDQTDSYMKASMQQALDGMHVSATPKMQQAMDDYSRKASQIFKEEMSWDKMEPLFVDVYKKSFSQSDVDGMIQFYKTPAGQSVVKKMPLVMQNSMQVMQQRMSTVMPKIMQLTEESTREMTQEVMKQKANKTEQPVPVKPQVKAKK